MRGRPTPSRRSTAQLERKLWRLASRQHGVVARRQLIELGFSKSAIDRRLRVGRLTVVHAGVYLVGHVAKTRLAAEMAAVLACGSGAVLSHRSAAVLWGLVGRPNGQVRVDVTMAADWAPARSGVRVHRVGRLERRDRTSIDGLPVTIPARTVLDLAAVLDPGELEAAAGHAERRHGVGLADLADQLDRNRGRLGAPTLRALVRRGENPALTRSKAERRLLALLRRTGCPRPEANQTVAGFEVDLLWAARRLVVEFDGFEFHADRAAFERDRRRDAELQARGYRVLRVTWRQLVDHPAVVADRISRTLER
jgi:very-short-patch-repair endonuclease